MRKLRLNISLIILAIFLFASSAVSGQEMLGVAFSTYNGINAASINPALLTGSKVYMDVNILSGNVSAANNMFYFTPDNISIRKVLKPETNFFKSGQSQNNRSFHYYDNADEKHFSTNIKFVGPSFMLQAGRHSFGLSTSFRSIHSGNHIPFSIPITSYEGLSYPEYQDVEFDQAKYSIVSMSWSELGLSYAYDLYDLYRNRLTIGITAKALFGYEGGYSIMRHSNYTIYNSRSVDFKNLDAEFGYALPVSYENELATDFGPLVKGYGVGFDFGIAFTRLKSHKILKQESKLCAKPYKDYIYKIGFSILDIGGITFSKDAELHKFENVSKDWVDFDTIHFRGIDEAVQIYSTGFYGDSDASYSGDKIRVNLPATVSLQFDYHFQKHFYMAAMWMHPLKFDDRTLWRPAQLAVIPRYENDLFGLSMPVSVFNYSDLRVGLALRFMFVTIGTDRIGSFLGISNFDGMDIYFSIRFSILKGICASSLRGACSNSRFGSNW